MPEPALDVYGLGRRYGDRDAVRDLTFSAGAGEIVGLLGPNGSGKTTTIRMLTTVLAPTSGSFTIAGVPGERPDEIRRLVGALPESSGYPRQITGLTFLTFAARLSGSSRPAARRIASELLAELELDRVARQPIGSYSRGMRQRLGIARAMVHDPAVLFLDEPALGLDPRGQRQMLGMITNIARQRGTTVILSSHTLPDIQAVCDTVLILREGRRVAAGSLARVMAMSAGPGSGRLRVPPEQQGAALALLHDLPDTSARPGAAPGELTVQLTDGADTMLRALVDHRVPVLAFDVTGGGLEEVFRQLTEAPPAGETAASSPARPDPPAGDDRAGAADDDRPEDAGPARNVDPAPDRRDRPDRAVRRRGWLVVAGKELQEAWAGGRGPALVVAFSVLLSLLTYLTATNRVLNYLEQRETVALVLQVAVAVSALLTLLSAADAISGERERDTLETLLLTPVGRRHLLGGKLVAALSIWGICTLVTVPYLWVLAAGVTSFGSAVALQIVVGGAVAAAMACLGLVISGFATGNRVSLGASLVLLLVLYAPTQLPAPAQQGPVGALLVRVNPIAAADHYLSLVLVSGRSPTSQLDFLVSPALTLGLTAAALLLAGDRLLALVPRINSSGGTR